MNQSESGKAFKYGVARAAADIFSKCLSGSQARKNAQDVYDNLSDQEKQNIDNAASEAICFLRASEPAFRKNVSHVSMQADSAGEVGDVRDIVIHATDGTDIGISTKHRHHAVKHSRLSTNLDFGSKWYGVPCSEAYWEAVSPIFAQLDKAKGKDKLWRHLPNYDLPSKEEIYADVLEAFACELQENGVPSKLVAYLIGLRDYYKVTKDNGDVVVQSFNCQGTLKWGKRLSMPTEINNINYKGSTTALVQFDRGWSMSFRLHNANKNIEPSLKFDIRLLGSPEIATNRIRYR